MIAGGVCRMIGGEEFDVEGIVDALGVMLKSTAKTQGAPERAKITSSSFLSNH